MSLSKYVRRKLVESLRNEIKRVPVGKAVSEPRVHIGKAVPQPKAEQLIITPDGEE